MVDVARRAVLNPPLITLSVVSHGDATALKALLESLARCEHTDPLQLIVTDNLCNDIPDLEARNWNSLILLRNDRPQGYGSNHNAAFRRAQGQYFCVLNPDVLFVESIFPRLLADLDAGDAHVAAPLLTDSQGRVLDSFRSLPAPLELLRRRVAGSSLASEIPGRATIFPDWIAGTFMLMRRQTFADLRGFDARYRLYFEDVDLCTRARLTGRSILVDTRVRVQHAARRTSRRNASYLFWHLQSAFQFFTSDVYHRARKLPAGVSTGQLAH